MRVRYAKSYIDQLYENRDVCMLRAVVNVIARQSQLPEQFSVFAGLWDWACSARSGIYQYYECMEHRDIIEFESLAGGLERFGFHEIANRYRSGKDTWRVDLYDELDHWIGAHISELKSAAFDLIAESRACLYDDEP